MEVGGNDLVELDAKLVSSELARATRRNGPIAFRSVLRCATESGMLESMPKLPKLPIVGRKQPKNIHIEDVEAVFAHTSAPARLACELAAFAGLRASEVRGLRWTDIDFRTRTLTVPRALTLGEEVTPKSHHQRAIPIGAQLLKLLSEAFDKKQGPWAPVAVTGKGEHWGETGLNQALQQAQKRARKSGWCYHDLRHFLRDRALPSGRPGVSLAAAARSQRACNHATPPDYRRQRP